MSLWSVLQSASNTVAVSGTTISVTLPNNCQSGTVLLVSTPTGSFWMSGVKDGANNAFTQLGDNTSQFWAIRTPSGDIGIKPTITATAVTTVSQMMILVQEISGVIATADAENDGGSTGGSGTLFPHTNSITTTAAGEYYCQALWGVGSGGNLTYTVPSSLTGDPNGINGTNLIIEVAYRDSTGGAEGASPTWSITGTGNAGIACCALKLANPPVIANAGLASATGRALSPSIGLTVNAGLATATGNAFGATAVIPPNLFSDNLTATLTPAHVRAATLTTNHDRTATIKPAHTRTGSLEVQ